MLAFRPVLGATLPMPALPAAGDSHLQPLAGARNNSTRSDPWPVVLVVALLVTCLGPFTVARLSAQDGAGDGIYRVEGKPFIRRAGFGGGTTFGKGIFLLQDTAQAGGENDVYARSGLNTLLIDVPVRKEGDYDFPTVDACFDRARKANLKVVFHLGQGIPGWLAKQRDWHWIGADGSVIPNEKGRPHHIPEEYAAAITQLWKPLIDRYREDPLLIGYQISGEHHPFDSVSAKIPISYDPWTLSRFRTWILKRHTLVELAQRYGRKVAYGSADDVLPIAMGDADFKGTKLANAVIARWDWYRFKKETSVEAWAAMVQAFQALDGHGRSVHYEYNHGPYSDIRFFPMPAVAAAAPGFGFGNGDFEDSMPWTFLYAGFVKTASREPWINNELEAGWTGSFRNDPTSIDAAYLRRHIWGNLAMGSQGYNLWTFCNLMNYTPDRPKDLVRLAADPLFARSRPLKYFEVQHCNAMIDALGDLLAASTVPTPSLGLFMLDDANFNWMSVDSYNHDALGIVHALVAAACSDQLGIYSEYHLDSPVFDLDRLTTVIIPRTPRMTEAHMARLAAYVRKGGHLIIMGETGRIGESFSPWQTFPGGPLAEVVGCTTRLLSKEESRQTPLQVHMADGTPIHLDARIAPNQPLPADVTVLAGPPDAPAIVAHRLGKGLCHYLTGDCVMVDDGDRTADGILSLLRAGGSQPALTLGEGGTRATGVFAARRVGPAGTLLFLIETGDTPHDLVITLDPGRMGLAPDRNWRARECFSDEDHPLGAVNGFSFATQLEAAGVRCFIISDSAQADADLSRSRRLAIPRSGHHPLLARGPWDATAGAQRPYFCDDAINERRERLKAESLVINPSAMKQVDLGGGYVGLDFQAACTEPLSRLIADVELGPQIFGVAAESGAAMKTTLPMGAGPVAFGGVPAFTGPRFLSVRRSVTGIPVGMRIASLHLFHGGHYSEHDALIGHYRVRYEDGSQETIPAIIQSTIGDFTRPLWRQAKYAVIHEGKDDKGKVYRLNRYDWTNPHPDRTVAAIDIVNAASTKDNSFKVWALTVRKKEGQAKP